MGFEFKLKVAFPYQFGIYMGLVIRLYCLLLALGQGFAISSDFYFLWIESGIVVAYIWNRRKLKRHVHYFGNS